MDLTVAPATPQDAPQISRLLREYLTRTEHEKVAQGVADPASPQVVAGELVSRYQEEIDHPEALLEHCLVARHAGRVVGLVVSVPHDGQTEIKRLWVDPQARGQGAGRALLRAAINAAQGPVVLTVWDWRVAPIALYQSLGFTVVPSWDARPRLLCLMLPEAR